VSVLRVWPHIVERIDPAERTAAERALVVPLLKARDGDLSAALAACDAFGFVLVDGIVLIETTRATVRALEFLGPGDVLAWPVSPTQQRELRGVSRPLAFGQVSLAVLDRRFQLVAARRPRVAEFLHDQMAEQSHRASVHLALLHLTRAEDRVLALFTDLADRFGRVTPDGIRIGLPLTHDLIGRLTACRRPTVSLALRLLQDQGLLTRLADKSWQLAMNACC
jgi:CRP-like cAMP-binding protein